MAIIRAFRAYRPAPAVAEQVASHPYDVLNSAEASALAADNPLSFLHVVKPEIDLPAGVDLYSDEVYAMGATNLGKLIKEGSLIQEAAPALYVYRQRMGDHVQTGIVAGASVADYDADRIRKHERTRKAKEDDRTRHVDALDANTGPVFLTYRHDATVDTLIAKVTAGTPTYDFVADDDIAHTLWVVDDNAVIDALTAAFAAIDTLYVADGHHRSASASRVAAMRRDANPNHTGDEAYNFFLTVIFPDNQMKILDYNRIILTLADDLDSAALLSRVATRFDIELTDERAPSEPKTFGMRMGDTWYRLTAKEGTFDPADPVSSLDVAILQDNLLGPILGIDDPRTHNNIDFVGGIRGMDELDRRVEAGAALAFSLYPTGIEQLIAIADAGEIMPPKSTWFEPKLRSGLIVHPLS